MAFDVPVALLAGGVGVYLLLSAVGVLSTKEASEEIIGALRGNRALAHVTGAVAFFIGGMILLMRPGFGNWLTAMLSATAIWWMVEGALMLASSKLVFSRSDASGHFRRMNMLAIPLGFALIAGAALELA